MSVCKTESMKANYKFGMRRSPIAKVKRVLFGPVDPEDNKNFIQFHLNQDINRACLKWNFNFVNETTLNPEGDFIWQPTTPQPPMLINRKRKVPEVVVDESQAYYFQPIEPAARSQETQAKIVKQTQITDYMVKSKRQVVYAKDPSVERPKKIPKLADYCSS